MRRLVYAPKVWIFIRSSNLDGRIYDVSSDVVRGSVTQNLGDVSKANFELRNRFHKWIRAKDTGNRTVFLPMDLVTIWMQRISGRPIQVFTGYLDSVPYYQAYPGNAVFEATCTLKKLAYNWFDPGLMTFKNWFDENSQFTMNPATGEAIADEPARRRNPVDPGDVGPKNLVVTDTGFGHLLGRFMVDIGGWDAKDVLIDKMDPRLGPKAAELYSQIEKGINANIKELSALMAQLLGVNGVQGHDARVTSAEVPEATIGSGPKGPKGPDGHDITDPGQLPVVKKIVAAATAASIPPAIMVFAALILSNLDPGYEQGQSEGTNWGFGLFAMRPNSGTSNNPGPNIPIDDIDQINGLLIDKVPIVKILEAEVASAVFAKRMVGPNAQGSWVAKARNGDIASIVVWINAALGRPVPPAQYELIYAEALLLAPLAAAMVADDQKNPSLDIDPENASFSDANVQNRLSDVEKAVIAQYYSSAEPEVIATLFQAKSVSNKLRIGHIGGLTKDQIFVGGPGSELTAFFEGIKNDERYSEVIASIGGKVQITVNGVKSQYSLAAERIGQDVAPWKGDGVKATTKKGGGNKSKGKRQMTDVKVMTEGGLKYLNSDIRASLGEGGATFMQLGAFSANAAFAANFSFPTDFIMANLVTGQKSLINDTSCLEAVKQFAAASLRTFRSLPDGRFLAFYPDYFGTRRKPYWKIQDIEIIDFGIQLNDEALATHVYVIGDHYMGAGQAWQDVVVSRGLATVTHAGILDSMINWGPSGSSGPAHRLLDGHKFLQHYGARPHKYGGSEKGAAFIQNTMYEFLLAWQTFMWLWAQQFATSVTFTFQPEVMAGGLIEFGHPHDIQMFCESVTHNFDYSSGFTTEAVMTAPALTKNAKRKSLFNFPGFALAGGVNTVGVGGG